MHTQDPTRPGRPGRTTLEDYLAFRDRTKSLCKLAAHAGIEAAGDNPHLEQDLGGKTCPRE